MLHRKLLRDLSASKWLFVAVTAVIALGVAFFGASYLGYSNLKTSYDYTHDTLRFADFTVKVVQAPGDVVEELESLPGVDAVSARLNYDMALTLPGDEEKRVLARVISLPSDARPAVNDVKVEEGRYFEAGETDAMLVENSFADYHGLEAGDTLYLTADGQEVAFAVAGLITSPEYIWAAKNLQEVFTTAETFGVLFVAHEAVTDLMGIPVVNEFCFLVDEDADRDAVVDDVEELLEPYYVTEIVPREEQPSNLMLSQDLEGFGEIAEVFPLLFLIVGALATYILLTRVVYRQRAQVGLMRAVGYSRRQVLLHYLGFALVIGVAGALVGTLAGYLLSELVTSLYVGFLNLPYIRTEVGWEEWVAIEEGLLIGILPCVVAGILPAFSASRLVPAEAMRTPPPAAGRKILLERLFPSISHLSATWKVPLRNIFRTRRRSLYTVTGIAFGVSLMLVSAAFIDTVDYFVGMQFDDVQRYDARIDFAQPQPLALVDEVEGWTETGDVEPVLQVPVRLDNGSESVTTLLLGLPQDGDMFGVYSTEGDGLAVDGEGVYLSEGLRKTLDVDVGDTVDVRSAAAVTELEVAGIARQSMGAYAYSSLGQAQSVAGVEDVLNGLMVGVEPQYTDSAVRERAYQMPGATSVELTSETYEMVEELMGFMRGMMYVMLGFGAVMAFAIVFTVVSINIIERSREIATMRTLGEGKGRIALMITVENLLVGLAGLIPGIPLGYALALSIFRLVETDMFSLTLAVFPRTYILTAGIVILIMLVSQLPGIRQVNNLNLPRVTKEQVT